MTELSYSIPIKTLINNYQVRLKRLPDGRQVAFVVDVIRGVYHFQNITHAATKWEKLQTAFDGTSLSFLIRSMALYELIFLTIGSEEFSEHELSGYAKRPQTFATANGIVAVLRALKGPKAEAFHANGAEQFVRFLGGDDALIRELRGENKNENDNASEDGDELTNAMNALAIDDRRLALMERKFRLFENARRSIGTWADSQVQDTIRDLIDRHVVTLFEEAAAPSTQHTAATHNTPDIAVNASPYLEFS